jgi:hypothetical protein
LDEAAKDERSLSRIYGYSLRNTHAEKKVVFVRDKRYTILPALTLQGFIAIDILEGSCTKERFKNFVISDVVKLIFIFMDFYIKCILLTDYSI